MSRLMPCNQVGLDMLLALRESFETSAASSGSDPVWTYDQIKQWFNSNELMIRQEMTARAKAAEKSVGRRNHLRAVPDEVD